ncbi:MAG: arabinogalactan endo-1,4-beta-galactosidase [Sphingobacteriia bacterium]|nr:arabinogalactan endo-1,4-beta-galactosidase [Sphingobacteriia bacterium]
MKLFIRVLLLAGITTFAGCRNETKKIYLGADLSYVNEIESCGGVYRCDGKIVDPFRLFGKKGANIVRVRLWHTPEINEFCGFEDVKRTISRAKEHRMEVLLDFHYSDTWADPQHQVIPRAWENIDNLAVLGDSLFQFTLKTLLNLEKEHLMPEMVQVGNEVNIEIMQPADKMVIDSINWERNVFLLNKGIEAVREAEKTTGKSIQIMMHIAQPENAFWWFESAFKAGLHEFQWIGLSYYPKWSVYPFHRIPQAIDSLKKLFHKKVMIVETAYPHTLDNADNAGNILGEEALIPDFPATPEGQLDYLVHLTRFTLAGGGEGVIYWEPAWISSGCNTPWGHGSHWDNATFFDAFRQNEHLQAFEFFDPKQYY